MTVIAWGVESETQMQLAAILEIPLSDLPILDGYGCVPESHVCLCPVDIAAVAARFNFDYESDGFHIYFAHKDAKETTT